MNSPIVERHLIQLKKKLQEGVIHYVEIIYYYQESFLYLYSYQIFHISTREK